MRSQARLPDAANVARTEEQRRTTRRTVADVDASGRWPVPVVTEVEPAGTFWSAEEEHQDYLRKHRDGYTCHWCGPTGAFRSGTSTTSRQAPPDSRTAADRIGA